MYINILRHHGIHMHDKNSSIIFFHLSTVALAQEEIQLCDMCEWFTQNWHQDIIFRIILSILLMSLSFKCWLKSYTRKKTTMKISYSSKGTELFSYIYVKTCQIVTCPQQISIWRIKGTETHNGKQKGKRQQIYPNHPVRTHENDLVTHAYTSTQTEFLGFFVAK